MGKRNKKRPYRAVAIDRFDWARTQEQVEQQRVIIGIDVAKQKMVAAVFSRCETVHQTVKWNHPAQTPEFIAFLEALAKTAASVEVAMEPSGVYGDALRHALISAGFDVSKVNPRHTRDMVEIHDGVPSSHDAKCAAIVATLHLRGKSDPWPMEQERTRDLAAALRMLEIPAKQYRQHRNRLEGLTARHWPELTYELELSTATALALLARYGGPAGVASDPEGARELALSTGGSKLDPAKVDRVIAMADRTLGVPQVDREVELVRFIAEQAQEQRRLRREAERRVERLSVAEGATAELAPVFGKTTAAVIAVGIGDPLNFESPQAMVKAVGLNLREHSSGKHQGGLHITKRGSGVARMYLYMAALRMIKANPVVGAWYAKKVQRDGGRTKVKAVVAVMRKLVAASWHVARGESFDASKLYDVRRLGPAVAL